MRRIALRRFILCFASVASLAGCESAEIAIPTPPASAFDIDHAAQIAALKGDAVRGAKIFRTCQSCHRIDSPRHRTGPHLVELFGRQAGRDSTYAYSAASRTSGIVWSVETLSEYLRSPTSFMPGTKMNYPGVKDHLMPDLLAYLYEKGGVAPKPAAADRQN